MIKKKIIWIKIDSGGTKLTKSKKIVAKAKE